MCDMSYAVCLVYAKRRLLSKSAGVVVTVKERSQAGLAPVALLLAGISALVGLFILYTLSFPMVGVGWLLFAFPLGAVLGLVWLGCLAAELRSRESRSALRRR